MRVNVLYKLGVDLQTSFEFQSGVKQGCYMSEFLFLLVIDWIMSKAIAGNHTGLR